VGVDGARNSRDSLYRAMQQTHFSHSLPVLAAYSKLGFSPSFVCRFSGGLECVGHSFAYVANGILDSRCA
jgi:hypothetical protein